MSYNAPQLQNFQLLESTPKQLLIPLSSFLLLYRIIPPITPFKIISRCSS